MTNPQELGFYQPAEWEAHSACWLAFPSDRSLWLESLEAAQTEFVALARVIGQSETLKILVANPMTAVVARQALGDLGAKFYLIPYGDIWMRDIAPIFLVKPQESLLATVSFAWNGWGHKYLLEHDDQVAIAISKSVELPAFSFPWVLEGGAVEVDGEGTCLTTKQCLLNTNRNPTLNQTEIELGLQQALGVKKVLWIDEGLLNDHTDGHIDTIARFIAPGVVMCMRSQTSDDPNYEVLKNISTQLSGFTDAQGRNLAVIEIPSPGLVADDDGEIMPASYLNFYISNQHVIVPTYGSEFDDQAVNAIALHFPTRQTVGLPAKTILLGGGAFHCITQQQPKFVCADEQSSN
jgi:agmatine deiminase